MANEKANQLAADTINGVYVCENPTDQEILDSEMFYKCLADLPEGETIYGLVTDEMAEKIASEYGIR
jgi:hypothetical protein